MPRDINGTYTAPTNSWNPAIPSTVIDAADWNSTQDDYVAALTDSLSRTGDGGMEADLDMGGFNITNLGTSSDASTIDYTPGFTGGVATTVAIALNRVLHLKDFGAGGTSDDTALVQAAFNAAAGGPPLIIDSGTWTCTNVSVGSDTTVIGGGGVIKQKAASDGPLKVAGASRIRVYGVNFIGTAVNGSIPYANGASNCWAIRINQPPVPANSGGTYGSSGSEIFIENCRFELFLYACVDSYNTTNIVLNGNYIKNCQHGPIFTDCRNLTVSNNIVDGTCLFSPGTNPTSGGQLTAGVAMGGYLGPCLYFTISNNVIKNLGYSQAIFAHSAEVGTITGNQVDNASMGIYLALNAAPDVIGYVTISGNQLSGTSGITTIPTESEGGIIVSGNNIVVTGNLVSGFNNLVWTTGSGANTSAGSLTSGGIQVAGGPVAVTGNTIQGCSGNGVGIKGDVDGVTVTGNTINNVVAIFVGGSNYQFGVLTASANGSFGSGTPTGIISGNTFNHISSIAGYGIYVSGGAPCAVNLLYSGLNQFVDVTLHTSP